MTMWTDIRRRVLTGQTSKRAICREYEIHWKTLEKILSHSEPPGYRSTKPRPRPLMERFLPIIEAILKQDRTAHHKQRHTAKRIFDRLCSEHKFSGSYSTVKEAVRELKRKQQEVFVPLDHAPASAQVDFGEVEIKLNGEVIKAAFFELTLPYSDAIFCQVFPRECTETFQEGHRRAFEFFGGVPRRISYDNSRIAVRRIVGQRGVDPTREFLRLQSHYLFEHHFCRVRKANEKGHVENHIGFARRNFLVPIPEVESLEALNESLVEQCRQDLQRTVRGQRASKAELLKEDQAAFLPLPKQSFEARRIETPKVNSLSLVRFDCNDYSVPTEYAYQRVTAVGGIDEVRFVVNDRVIACHKRCWEKERTTFDPRHYLALLERKPGAFDYAKPLKEWELADCFTTLRRRLEAELEDQGVREFIKVLRLLELATLKQLTVAVDKALEIGATSVEAIKLLLQCEREEPSHWFRLDGRPHLAAVHVPQPNLQAYASLTAGGEA